MHRWPGDWMGLQGRWPPANEALCIRRALVLPRGWGRDVCTATSACLGLEAVLLAAAMVWPVCRLGIPQLQTTPLQNEGMPIHGRPYEKGNLYIHFAVEFPDQLAPEAASALRSLLGEPAHTNGVVPMEELEEVQLTPVKDIEAEIKVRREHERRTGECRRGWAKMVWWGVAGARQSRDGGGACAHRGRTERMHGAGPGVCRAWLVQGCHSRASAWLGLILQGDR